MTDLRIAFKSLIRTPSFTLISIATLALGIGANTSMFGLLHNILLRPSSYPESHRVERIYRGTPQNARGYVSPADWLDVKQEMKGYGEIAAYTVTDMSLSEPGKPAEMVLGARSSANLFSTLQTEPGLGRVFAPRDEIPGNDRVVVASERFWRNRLGADADVVGKIVRIDGEPHEIVGVMSATIDDWRHLGRVDLYKPLAFDEKQSRDRSGATLRLVGRRDRNLTKPQADAFIANFGNRLAKDHPAQNADSTWRTLPIQDTLLPKQAEAMLGMLVGLSGFVLLIACSNLANLLLARTIARAREFAVRAALGGSRLRVLRPLFLETLLLAIAGGVAAVFVASWTLSWISTFDIRKESDWALNWPVLGWGLVACFVTAAAFGIAPALFAQRLDLNDTLKSGSRGMTGDRGHRRFRHALIVGQFAFAMILLAGAAIFQRGVESSNTKRYGWVSDQLVTGTLLLPTGSYDNDTELAEFQRSALERLGALPGAASASLSWSMPFLGLGEARKYLVAGQAARKPGDEPVALVNGVSPRYFETMGIQLLSGRVFGEADTLASTRVFVINEAMARGLFGSESALGRQLARAGTSGTSWGEVVGVVADTQSVSLDPSPVRYQLYQPMAQEPRRSSEVAVKRAGIAAAALVESIRTTMMSLDPDLPVRQLEPADATIARVNFGWDIVGKVLSMLAALGLGLAALGVYGIVARTVAQRTGEFGIRLALGAGPRDITRLVLTSGAKLALVGSALGLLGAVGVSRLIASAFPAMQMSVVPALAFATVVLVAIAQLACYVPARHASRISPTEALRTE
jgi:predicted permease